MKEYKKETGPKQDDIEKCRYYVMQFMHDIILSSNRTIVEMKGSASTYSHDDLDAIRMEWAEFVNQYLFYSQSQRNHVDMYLGSLFIVVLLMLMRSITVTCLLHQGKAQKRLLTHTNVQGWAIGVGMPCRVLTLQEACHAHLMRLARPFSHA
uniref:Uncharacterized protein n=1 Tax=Cucumis melo TaxID=3656 RepID=A0A9I9EBC2_CUCME